MDAIAKILRKWYKENRRDLPWRSAESAYEIWLSEIILQQTRVQQGIPYYKRFMKRFPDVYALAGTSTEEVLKLWQGLGYYSRARNLHATAREIVETYGGRFPADYHALMRLKGIGEYTAAAVASMAFSIPVALVDGNVLRVLSRVYGIRTPVTSTRGKKEIRRLAEHILDKKDPGIHNQAVMELGALVCLPGNPSCGECPLNQVCHAYRHGQVSEFPVREAREKARRRYFHYLHVSCGNIIFIHQRKARDIWNSLFEFPLIETPFPLEAAELQTDKQWKRLFKGSRYRIEQVSPLYIHHLSHQILHARFYRILTDSVPPALAKEYIRIGEGKIFEYPVSRLTEKYLETL